VRIDTGLSVQDFIALLKEQRIAVAGKVRLTIKTPYCFIPYDNQWFVIYLCPNCEKQTALRIGRDITFPRNRSTTTECDQCASTLKLFVDWSLEPILKNISVEVFGKMDH
jgi:predicted RNA-binding Zn-ribbon protein involved in translation (DUF1610 family)